MSHGRVPTVRSITPKVLVEDLFLHIRPTNATYSDSLNGFIVSKVVKTIHAEVAPGDYIVKLKVSIPREFFIDAMPAVEVMINARDALALPEIEVQSGDNDV